MFNIYFAKSLKNGKVYVGRTEKTAEQRVKEHNQGFTKWTKQNGPFKLIYYENYFCKDDAVAKENFYKSGVGKKIKKAILEVMNK